MQNRHFLALTGVCLSLVAGCGGAAKGIATGPASAYDSPAASPARGNSYAGASAAESKSAPASAATPDERLGLGTAWGETRTSRVYDTTFIRANGGQSPVATALFQYDNARGIRNALGHANLSRYSQRDISSGDGFVSVAIRTDSGSLLPSYSTTDRTYVAGSDGQRYLIHLHNKSHYRIEVVATVDGLDVVTGESGSVSNRGYVMESGTSLDIDGFRKNEREVAAFRFSSVKESYAARTGNDRNVGVIGVAIFAEEGSDWDASRERQIRDNANPFPDSRKYATPPPRY